MNMSKNDTNAVFNKPFFWVNEFIMNNFCISKNDVANKSNTYNLYQKYAIKLKKGYLTFEEFNNEIIQIPNIECIKHCNGVEYFTNLKYRPLKETDDEFFTY